MGSVVQVLKELFTTDAGLSSAAGIVFMLGMAALFVRHCLEHLQDDSARGAWAKV